MDMISIIASIMLVLGCLYFILSPFIQKNSIVAIEAVNIVDDKIKKEELYATLNEMEMDYKMNKLSEEDYKNMKIAYEFEVAQIIKNEGIEGNKSSISKQKGDLIQQIEDEIDEELAVLRNERGMKQ